MELCWHEMFELQWCYIEGVYLSCIEIMMRTGMLMWTYSSWSATLREVDTCLMWSYSSWSVKLREVDTCLLWSYSSLLVMLREIDACLMWSYYRNHWNNIITLTRRCKLCLFHKIIFTSKQLYSIYTTSWQITLIGVTLTLTLYIRKARQRHTQACV